MRGSRILGVGVMYNADVNDVRESPPVGVPDRLVAAGARISYHDPFVRRIQIAARRLRSQPLAADMLAAHGCVVMLPAYSGVDFEHIVKQSPPVFDARGVTRVSRRNVVRL